MQAYRYTTERLDALTLTLSAQRLQPYIDLAGGDRTGAFHLYTHNTNLSQSFHGPLQGLEIALRNTIHAVLTRGLGREDWYNCDFMQPEQTRQINQANGTLKRQDKLPSADRMIAELSFGFWTGLTGPRYSDLWRDHLVQVFPRRTLQRADAHARLDTIRKLRNRIAHYEPILSRPLQKDFDQIVDAIAWICPVSSRWIRTSSILCDRLAARIQTPVEVFAG